MNKNLRTNRKSFTQFRIKSNLFLNYLFRIHITTKIKRIKVPRPWLNIFYYKYSRNSSNKAKIVIE